MVEDERTKLGRSVAFREMVLEIYDHWCNASGLLVRPALPPLSLVDAAHLVPFAESFNDHPSNGLALCKNHHWAMDSGLIAPRRRGCGAARGG
ncbi:MAG: HNH endonuclease [Alphaproteobacteria bacterium]|nr:HNH endonuclease [Alphaproteobacteria bacterium]